jgi:hypothetical protein
MSESVTPRPIPEPGIFYDVPASVYFAWDAVNASFLKKMASRCAAVARYEADHPSPPTPAMLQGSVCHTQLFEPDKITNRYVVASDCASFLASGSNKGQPCGSPGRVLSGGQWYCGRHAGGHSWDDIPIVGDEESGGEAPAIVSEDMIAKAKAMAIRARWDHKIRELLVGARFEVCIVWVDPVTEMLCKARLDIYRPDTYQIGDLKTCEDASEDGFSKQIGDLGYDIQAAFYLDAATSLEGVLHDDFIFIAQEKEPPYVAAAYRLHQEAIALGRFRYRKALADVKWCKENDLWPGYSDHQIVPIHVTKYFFDKESHK